MKLLTVKEIKEMAFQYLHKNYKCHNGDNGSIFTKGLNPGRELDKSDLVLLIIKIYSQAQRDIIESASEGFEETMLALMNSWTFNPLIKGQITPFAKDLYEACALSHAKKMQEKDAEIVSLKKENEELKKEVILSRPLYLRRILEDRIKVADEIIVSWNDYLKKENELAAKVGTVADDYIAKWIKGEAK